MQEIDPKKYNPDEDLFPLIEEDKTLIEAGIEEGDFIKVDSEALQKEETLHIAAKMRQTLSLSEKENSEGEKKPEGGKEDEEKEDREKARKEERREREERQMRGGRNEPRGRVEQRREEDGGRGEDSDEAPPLGEDDSDDEGEWRRRLMCFLLV